MRLSTFSGSSGLTGRICAKLVKAKWFRVSWTLKVEYVLGWGLVGGKRLYRLRSGRERRQGVELNSC